MKFYEALKKMMEEGMQIKRKDWDKGEFWEYKADEYHQEIVYHERDFYYCHGEVTSILPADFLADDWEIRDDKKYMSFGEAFELMKKGHKIKHKLWGASYLYIDNKNNILKIKGYCTTPVRINSFGRYIFSLDEEDVLDNNWYVIE